MSAFPLIIVLVVLLVLLLVGSPVIFAIGGAAAAYFVTGPDQWMFINNYALKFFDGMNAFIWLSLPLFILAGEIMAEIGLTNRLLQFSRLIVGRFKGGLAYVNVLGSMLFGGVSGSALADVSALGPIEIDMMRKDGYRNDFSTALTCCSAIQGPIIPPSIPLIIFASLTGTSVGALFLAGAIPGIMLGVSQMVVIWVLSRRYDFPANPLRGLGFKGVIAVIISSIGALIMPAIVIGGIIFGIFTATEAAAVAVAYTILIGFLGYRNLSISKIWAILNRTIRTSASIYLIIAFVTIISWILAMEQLPLMIKQFVAYSGLPTWAFLLLLNVFFLLNGLWVSDVVQLVLFAPIFTPIVAGLGMDPVQFGVMMVFNIMLSMITPPYGLALYLGSSISGASLNSIVLRALPFLFASLIVLLLVTHIPALTLWLPSLLGLH